MDVIEAHRQIVASANQVEATGLLIFLRFRAEEFGWKDVARHLKEAEYLAGRHLGRACYEADPQPSLERV